jgi:iron(III) transport system ATP-binding protein
MVFQDFALFPHLDVAGNIGFGLAQLSRKDRQQKVEAMLDLVGLSDQAHSFPHQLSGGQQQRVALARALAPNPELLLLDEPFSSLDSELRESLAAEVRALLKASGVTAILVTHDQHEAFAMADHITLLKDGAVIQAGTPRELYQSPDQPFVADFIGQGSVITVVASDDGILNHELGIIDPAAIPAGQSGKLRLLLRANQVVIDSNSTVRLPVTGRAFRGAHFLYTLALPDGQPLNCLATIDVEVEIGDSLPVRLELTRPTIFAAD